MTMLLAPSKAVLAGERQGAQAGEARAGQGATDGGEAAPTRPETSTDDATRRPRRAGGGEPTREARGRRRAERRTAAGGRAGSQRLYGIAWNKLHDAQRRGSSDDRVRRALGMPRSP